MRLRYATFGFFLFGLILLGTLVIVMAQRPPTADHHGQRVYAVQSLSLFLATILAWFGAALCAYFSIRQTRREIVEEAESNMKLLIEGTLRDHENKSAPTEPNGSGS